MFKRLFLIFTFLLSFSFGFHVALEGYTAKVDFIVNTVYAATANRADTDDYCRDNLRGSSSKETCIVSCSAPSQCFIARKYLASVEPDLDKDVECFGCRRQICEDVGRLGASAKARCDAQPDYESKPAPALADGTPCWSCEKIVDQCKDKWPGTTLKATCDATCNDPARICAKIGNYNGQDCYGCVAKANPKPPKRCNDLGAIFAAQCGTCVDPTPNCEPAGFRDETGAICFQCAPKPKACKDIGKDSGAICANCRANGGKCLTDGRAPNGEQCYTCEDRKCADIGKETRAICAQCHADRNLCLPDGHSPSGERCYKCKERKSCKDEGKDNKDICTTCGENETCRYVSSAENGERCYACKKVPPKKTCKDIELLTDWDCETCEDDPDTKCEPVRKAENGEQCYQCVNKKGCEKEDLPKGACPANCPNGQKCVDSTHDGEACHDCVDVQCSDSGLKDSCESNQICNPVSPDGTDLQCCECKPKTCESYELKEACDGETEVCQETSVNGMDCCNCRKKNCRDLKQDDQSSCSQCIENRGECVPGQTAPNGEQCYSCVLPNCAGVDEKNKVACDSVCPGNGFKCDPAVKAPNGEQCYDCNEIPQDSKGCIDINKQTSRICRTNCLDIPGMTCVSDGTAPNGEECEKCVEKDLTDRFPCPEYTEHGKCIPGVMDPCKSIGQKCVDRSTEGAECYQCKPQISYGEPKDQFVTPETGAYVNHDEILTGPASGTIIGRNQTGVIPNDLMGGCPSPYIPWQYCDECYDDFGVCKPVQRPQFALEYNPVCYECVDDVPQCPRNQHSNCGPCNLKNMQCIPGNIVFAPESGEPFTCSRCIPKGWTVESIEYIIIIVETPRGRYVLGGGGGGLGSVASGMALGKAGSIPGLSSFGSISIQDLSSKLKQGLNDGGKYSDDCFKDFTPAQAQQTPPSTDSASGGGSSGDYGRDTSTELEANAPIVTCGNEDGNKILSIFDATGALVSKIQQQDLEANPDAILNALGLAQENSKRALDIKVSGVSGLQQKAANAAVAVLDGIIRKGFAEEEKSIYVPNDPFYKLPPEKKKKKLLGIIGSDKKPPVRISTGGSIRMGGAAGLGTGGLQKADDPKVADQWGLEKIGFLPEGNSDSAWKYVDQYKKNTVVAVIDTGLDMTHPDGPAYVWQNPNEKKNGIDDDNNGYIDDINGWNFLDNNNNLTDHKGHGTFVAGIIAAKSNNGIGIAGINPGAIIMPLKVANEEGETNSFFITRAIYYAVNNGARVINISLGGRVLSQMEEMAIKYAHDMGVFVAVASGNVGENIGEHGPASAFGAFTVGAIDTSGDRSTISNQGANNALLAPGEEVYSLLSKDAAEGFTKSVQESGYYTQSGTSFSTPMVAATASLLLAKDKKMSNDEIADVLMRTADDMYDPGWDGLSGAGVLNATAALKQDKKSEVTVQINKLRQVKEKKLPEAVDVFATVRGKFKSFTVEVGKGKHAKNFTTVAGPLTQEANNDWVARIDKKEYLRGSRDWVVRLNVTLKNGQTTTAETLLELQ